MTEGVGLKTEGLGVHYLVWQLVFLPLEYVQYTAFMLSISYNLQIAMLTIGALKQAYAHARYVTS